MPVITLFVWFNMTCRCPLDVCRPQEEKGQGRPSVSDDAQRRSAGHGIQRPSVVGWQGSVGEQDCTHVGHSGGVQEAVQRRRSRWIVQDDVRDRQAAGDDALASVRRARCRRHVRQLRQQRTVRAKYCPTGRRALSAARRLQGPRQGRGWWWRRSSDDVVRSFVTVVRRATRFRPEGRSALNAPGSFLPTDPVGSQPPSLTPPQPPTNFIA